MSPSARREMVRQLEQAQRDFMAAIEPLAASRARSVAYTHVETAFLWAREAVEHGVLRVARDDDIVGTDAVQEVAE